MIRGKYIVIEGLKGSGKTTQAKLLAARLRAAQLPVKLFQEAKTQNDHTGNNLRSLTDNPDFPMNNKSEMLIYNAIRSQTHDLIEKSLEQGIYCVIDQSFLTTLALHYYGHGDIVDYSSINQIAKFASDGTEPDLTVILDTPIDQVLNRVSHDTDQQAAEIFFEKVRAGYLWEAKQRQLPIVYANAQPSEIADQIWRLVTPVLTLRNQPANTNSVPIAEIIETKLETLKATEATQSLDDMVQKESRRFELEGISLLLSSEITSYQTAKSKIDATGDDFPKHSSFYVPPKFNKKTRQHYQQEVASILKKAEHLYEGLVNYIETKQSTTQEKPNISTQEQARELVMAVLPLSTRVNLSLSGTKRSFKDLANDLLSSDLAEAENALGLINENLDLANEARENGDDKSNDIRKTKAFQKLVADNLIDKYSDYEDSVNLVNYRPKNELDLIADASYAQTNLDYQQLRREVGDWSYQLKTRVLKAYLDQIQRNNDKSNLALKSVQYTWDVICSFEDLNNLQSIYPYGDYLSQSISPRYGYEVPALVDEARLTEDYQDCFDKSLDLFSYLQKNGYVAEAPYATLLGHKLRCQISYSLQDLLVLERLNPKSPTTRQLVVTMLDKVRDVHPILSDFVLGAA